MKQCVLTEAQLKVTDGEFVSFITPAGDIVQHANGEHTSVEG
jgi:hypothetical protein